MKIDMTPVRSSTVVTRLMSAKIAEPTPAPIPATTQTLCNVYFHDCPCVGCRTANKSRRNQEPAADADEIHETSSDFKQIRHEDDKLRVSSHIRPSAEENWLRTRELVKAVKLSKIMLVR